MVAPVALSNHRLHLLFLVLHQPGHNRILMLGTMLRWASCGSRRPLALHLVLFAPIGDFTRHGAFDVPICVLDVPHKLAVEGLALELAGTPASYHINQLLLLRVLLHQAEVGPCRVTVPSNRLQAD